MNYVSALPKGKIILLILIIVELIVILFYIEKGSSILSNDLHEHYFKFDNPIKRI